MLALLLALVAVAAPPSTTLSGPEGKLTWTVSSQGDGVRVQGTSPKWKVDHLASASLAPRSTVHTAQDGTVVKLTWHPGGVTLQQGAKVRELKQDGLWDGDTLDVRLGSEVAAGHLEIAFSAVDPESGKIYSFDTAKVADATCAGAPCTQVRVQLTGVLRYLGPTWNYWYAADGRLMRFEGPAGAFAAR